MTSADSRPLRRAALLHPITLAALGLWLVNDHILKGLAPGVFTGKASDVAGLVAFPIVLLATFPESFVKRVSLPRATSLAVIAVAGVFVAINVSETLSRIAGYVLSLLPRLVAAIGARSVVPLLPRGRSGHVADAEDLLVLPFVLVPVFLVRRLAMGDSRRDS